MRLYENEAKTIFSDEGLAVPREYGVITSPDELDSLKDTLSFPLMVKALVLTGGRGKAGGIKKANDLKEAAKWVVSMLGMKIKDYEVSSLLLEEAVTEVGACYIGVTMNPANYNNIIMVSASGGVEIETVAQKNPEAILKLELEQNERVLPSAAARKLAGFLAERLTLPEPVMRSVEKNVSTLYALFQKYDCKVAEINPLIITPDGCIAADAKVVLDDNGLYRLGGLLSRLNITGARHDVSEPSANEIRARKAGFPYVDLLPENAVREPGKLYVGLVPGGAGYGIFSIDEVSNIGDRFFDGRVIPVNFMDSGGGPTLARVAEMFHLLMDYEIVDLIITSRFGGISSCDTFIRGLVNALRDRYRSGKRMVPVYGRMVGTDLPSARDFLEKARRETPEPLKNMDIIVGNRIIMADIIRQGIQQTMERMEKTNE